MDTSWLLYRILQRQRPTQWNQRRRGSSKLKNDRKDKRLNVEKKEKKKPAMSSLISKHGVVLPEIQRHPEQRTVSEIPLIQTLASDRKTLDMQVLKENKQHLERAESKKVEK